MKRNFDELNEGLESLEDENIDEEDLRNEIMESLKAHENKIKDFVKNKKQKTEKEIIIDEPKENLSILSIDIIKAYSTDENFRKGQSKVREIKGVIINGSNLSGSYEAIESTISGYGQLIRKAQKVTTNIKLNEEKNKVVHVSNCQLCTSEILWCMHTVGLLLYFINHKDKVLDIGVKFKEIEKNTKKELFNQALFNLLKKHPKTMEFFLQEIQFLETEEKNKEEGFILPFSVTFEDKNVFFILN
jgi:hypothetical protein